MYDFTDQVAVVTGASGALGGVLATAFTDAGARVAALDLKPAADLPGDRTLSVQVDLTDEDSVRTAVTRVMDRFGRVDMLANIAGGFAMGPKVHETSLEDWTRMLDLNARSVFLMCRAVLPHMLTQGGGKIVSVAARVANAGKGNMAPYSVAKSAVARLTESMAAEYRAQNINVNCIMPGTIDTPANRRDMPDADFSKWVPPAALADVICFLCSDGARAINGAAVPVYGLT